MSHTDPLLVKLADANINLELAKKEVVLIEKEILKETTKKIELQKNLVKAEADLIFAKNEEKRLDLQLEFKHKVESCPVMTGQLQSYIAEKESDTNIENVEVISLKLEEFDFTRFQNFSSNKPSWHDCVNHYHHKHKEIACKFLREKLKKIENSSTQVDSPPVRLISGDYSELVNSLTKIVRGDQPYDHPFSSIAAGFLKAIIHGLGKSAENYSATIVKACLESKSSTVLDLNNCIDGALKNMTRECFASVASDFSKALRTKTCSHSVFAAKVLTRYDFKHGCDSTTVNLLVSDLCDLCNSIAALEIRESAFEAIVSMIAGFGMANSISASTNEKLKNIGMAQKLKDKQNEIRKERRENRAQIFGKDSLLGQVVGEVLQDMDTMCVVCWDPVKINGCNAMTGCGHSGFCDECAVGIEGTHQKRCPLCRKYGNLIKLFF